MPNPIKAIKGGLTGIQNARNTIKENNKLVKATGGKGPDGSAQLVKKSLTPANVAKAFVRGAQNPAAAKKQQQNLTVSRTLRKAGERQG